MTEVETPAASVLSEAAPPRPARRFRRLAVFLGIGATAVAVAFVLFGLRRLRTTEVIPGILRSGQPSTGDIERAASRRGLRAVVNLRGRNPQDGWWQREVAVCARLGLALRHVQLETFDWPARREMLALVDAIDRLPRPMLLHCGGGSDRSGLASAVARMLAGEPPATAQEELGSRGGHVCRREACPLHRFLDRYAAFLGTERAEHSPERFRAWVRERYAPPPYGAEITLEQALPANAAPGEVLSIDARVTNRSELPWRMSSEAGRGVRLGVRAIGPFAALPEDPFSRFKRGAADLLRLGMEEGTVPAGGTRRFAGEFRAPAVPGRYLLQIDLVEEGVHWFSDLGYDGVVVPLTVESPPQA